MNYFDVMYRVEIDSFYGKQSLAIKRRMRKRTEKPMIPPKFQIQFDNSI